MRKKHGTKENVERTLVGSMSWYKEAKCGLVQSYLETARQATHVFLISAPIQKGPQKHSQAIWGITN